MKKYWKAFVPRAQKSVVPPRERFASEAHPGLQDQEEAPGTEVRRESPVLPVQKGKKEKEGNLVTR